MAQRESFIEGTRAHRAGEHARAVEALRSLLKRADLMGRLARYYSAMSYRAMGIADVRGGRYRQAADHLRQAIALIGNRADLAEYLAVAYARTCQPERCAAAAEVVADARPDDELAQLRLAQAQWRSGRRQQAVMTLNRALRRLSGSGRLHVKLGLFYAFEEDFESARRHLERATECDCTSVEAYRNLGLVESARGDFQAAAEAFQRALALYPGDLMVAYQLCLAADACARSGRRLKLSLPENVPPIGLSQMRQLAEYATAETDFIKAFLALPPSDIDEELFGVVGSVLRTALAYHADYADLNYLAGAASLRLGNLAAARAYTVRALEINPDYTHALMQMVELEVAAGLPQQAVEYLRRAVGAGADWPDVHARLGDLMKSCGRRASARQHYRRALELNRDYVRAAEGLASLAA